MPDALFVPRGRIFMDSLEERFSPGEFFSPINGFQLDDAFSQFIGRVPAVASERNARFVLFADLAYRTSATGIMHALPEPRDLKLWQAGHLLKDALQDEEHPVRRDVSNWFSVAGQSIRARYEHGHRRFRVSMPQSTDAFHKGSRIFTPQS